MSLIKKKDEVKTTKKAIVFVEDTYKQIDLYSQFLEMEVGDESRNYIVGEALGLLFQKDKDFQKYLKSCEVFKIM